MTGEEAIKHGKEQLEIFWGKNKEFTKVALKSLEAIGHLKDRPCSVCEFHKENGCCKWNCVFDEVEE